MKLFFMNEPKVKKLVSTCITSTKDVRNLKPDFFNLFHLL